MFMFTDLFEPPNSLNSSIYSKEYEDYLITGNPSYLQTLLPGTLEHEYIQLITELRKPTPYTDELDNQLQQFISKASKYNQAIPLQFIALSKKYNTFKNNPQKQSEIIAALKHLIPISLNTNISTFATTYTPNNYNNQPNTNITSKFQTIKYESILDNSIIQSINYIYNNIYSNKINPTDNIISTTFKNCNNIILAVSKMQKQDIKNAFTNLEYSILFSIIQRSIFYMDTASFISLFEYLYSNLQQDQIDSMINRILHCLSNEQIESLIVIQNRSSVNLSTNSFIDELIQRKFNTTTSTSTSKQKKELLMDINALLNKMNMKYQKIKRDCLLNILDINIQLNEYDLSIFEEYVQCPNGLSLNNAVYNLSQYNITQIQKYTLNYNNTLINKIAPHKEREIIEKHLTHFFINANISLSQFSNYFEQQFIYNQYNKALIYQGKEPNYTFKNQNLHLYNDIYNEIKLNICPYNKLKFSLHEDITLTLEIKNIQTLYVKIYEINTENYYYTNQCTFDYNISLEGLIPTYEDTYTFNQSNQILFYENITINQIPKNKRGLYIIEFIGKGYVSRAVIAKGSLTLIHKNTLNGILFYILDETNQICKGEHTGIWVNNTYYKSDINNGSIIIPYRTNNESSFIIYKHDTFACCSSMNLNSESYSLEAIWMIKEESLIMENKCSVILKPFLYMNNEPIDVSLLKNAKICVHIDKVENEEIIPISTVLDKVVLSSKREYTFEVKIPSKVRKISFTLNGEVEYKSIPKKNEQLSSVYELHVDDMIQNMFFVKEVNGDYIIEILGKNGEAIPHSIINLNLYHKYLNQGVYLSKILESDDNGRINLGKLNEIEVIEINNNFRFNIDRPKINYYDNITVIKGTEIKLPINNCNVNDIHLVKVLPSLNNKQIENHSHKITFDVSSNSMHTQSSRGYIYIHDIAQGNYLLHLGNNKSIHIEVINGSEWKNGNFIITDDLIYENNKRKSPCLLEAFMYKDKCARIQITPSSKQNTPRVHLIAFHYLQRENTLHNISELYINTMNYKFNNSPLNKFYTQQIHNCYLNNKLLDQEIQYVLDRKSYIKTLGNSLDKPSLLLKPQFMRETQTTIQEGLRGHDFTWDNRNVTGCKPQLFGSTGGTRYCNGFFGHDNGSYKPSLMSFNFIAKAPITFANLIPNENGVIELKCDLDEYSHAQVIVIDEQTCYEEVFDLNKINDIQKIDLRMGKMLNTDHSLCELRQVHTLYKGNTHCIKDIVNVSYQLIDSIEKYISYLLLVSDDNINDAYKQFQFILRFNTFALNEKLSYLSKYFSHEFNLFMYFHYNDFFNEYILPLLKFKIEKTFIDYFLMNDIDNILTYTSVDKLHKLNIIEKCLLIYSIRNVNYNLANSLALNIRIKAEDNQLSQNELQVLFMTALNIQKKEYEEQLSDTQMHMDMDKQTQNLKRILYGAYQREQEEECDDDCDMKMEMDGCLCDEQEGSELYMNDNKAAEVNNVQKAILSAQNIKKAKECKETQYYMKYNDNYAIESENMFYVDLVYYWLNNSNKNLQLRNENFLSKHIVLKPNSFREFMFIMSVLDLPLCSNIMHINFIKQDNLIMNIEATSNCILLTKELSSIQQGTSIYHNKIIINQQITDDTNIKNNNYLTNTAYTIKTIITNISNKTINCELLMQIPEGSLPLCNSNYTQIQQITIHRFQSLSYTQTFYFPLIGTYTQYPSSASINGKIIAKANIKEYNVVKEFHITKDDIKTIDDALKLADKQEIIDFISKAETISENEISKTYWLLTDKEFYMKLISILKQKLLFIPEVWKYSLIHFDIPNINEYIEYFIMNDKKNYNYLGNEFASVFINIDKTNNHFMNNHKDYFPVVPGRVHSLHQKESNILTVEFRNTYYNYISYLMLVKDISDLHWMRLCYYLILQQRMKEAKEVFDKIKEENVKGKYGYDISLQYDYIKAYIDFSFGYPEFKYAREISEKYKDIPLKTWNEMFTEIRDQLKEYDGEENFDRMIED